MDSSVSLWRRMTRAGSTREMGLTLTYYAAFVAIGLTTASLGPTLLGLAQQTGSDIAQISFLFTARALGYLLGSFGGGRVYDRLPGHRAMAVAIAVIAVLLVFVPFSPTLWLVTALLLGIGVMEGVVDVGGNTLIVWVHREKVGPYMNGLHLFYAVGAFLAPVIIAQAILFTGSFSWGYWVLALLLAPVIVRLIPLPSPAPIVSREEAHAARPPLALLTLFVLLFFMVAGAEQSFSGFIYTYSVKTGLTDPYTAAYVTAAYWGAFTIGRIASIPLATRLRPRVIILGDLALALIAFAILFMFPSSTAALWFGAALFGLGIASAFPTLLTFGGRHMTITGAITGWFFVGASAAGMVMPWLIGQGFDRIGPVSMLIVISGALILAVILFFILLRRVSNSPHAA